jgi:hypothetical protein
VKSRSSRNRSIIASAVAAIVAVTLAGCGGSPTAPAIVLTYVPLLGSGPAVTTAAGNGSSDSIAVVEINVTDVPDVLSASFTLEFDAAAVTFLDFDTTGSHLGSDGTTVQPIVQQTQAGRLTVGLTRLAVNGIDFDGTGLLLRVRFARSADSGTSALAFSNNDLLGDTAPPQSIPGVRWFGGSFRID